MQQQKTKPTNTQIEHWLAMAKEAMHNPSTPIKEHGHAYAVWILAQECLQHRASRTLANEHGESRQS